MIVIRTAKFSQLSVDYYPARIENFNGSAYPAMSLSNIQSIFNKDLPVLFLSVGWAESYTGHEKIRGAHGWLKKHPKNNSEANAFVRRRSGEFRCGASYGKLPDAFHLVLVSKPPFATGLRVVGLYAAATPLGEPSSANNWAWCSTRHAICIPPDARPLIAVWPRGPGMRRWAKHPSSNNHPALLEFFRELTSELREYFIQKDFGLSLDLEYARSVGVANDQAYEGQIQEVKGKLRFRLGSLRRKKLEEVKAKNKGRLICEVPGCAFDFAQVYGSLGEGYIHVHHLVPLAERPRRGSKTTLDELAVVCSNCHSMIHVGGECRPLHDLIPARRPKLLKAS